MTATVAENQVPSIVGLLVLVTSVCPLLVAGPISAQEAVSPPGQAVEQTSGPRTPDYTLSQIKELVRSGAARQHGARFDNQGPGCQTYLWKDSPMQHHAFFFARDGVFFGEFRDEQMENGRFLRITEHYLKLEARSPDALAKAEERGLPFVYRSTEFTWEGNTWVGSNVTWQFAIHDRNGDVLRAECPYTEKVVRRQVTLSVPEQWRPKGVEYYVGVFRPAATDYEKAMTNRVTPEGALSLEWAKVVDGQCVFQVACPETDPRLMFELHERKPPIPDDANPDEIRTDRVASMTVQSLPPGNEPVVFAPES